MVEVKYNKEHMAKSTGRSMSVSTKYAIEICDQIRNKKISKAKKILQDVIELKKAIPLRKFNKDTPHQKGVGPGRYPQKACGEILSLVESAEANAQFKGLNTSNLVIITAIANKAAKQWHYGRKRRRKMKRTHIEIIVAEGKDEKKKEAKKPAAKKEAPAKESKPKAEVKNDDKKPEKKESKPKLSSENEKGLEKTKASQKEAKPSKEDKK